MAQLAPRPSQQHLRDAGRDSPREQGPRTFTQTFGFQPQLPLGTFGVVWTFV